MMTTFCREVRRIELCCKAISEPETEEFKKLKELCRMPVGKLVYTRLNPEPHRDIADLVPEARERDGSGREYHVVYLRPVARFSGYALVDKSYEVCYNDPNWGEDYDCKAYR